MLAHVFKGVTGSTNKLPFVPFVHFYALKKTTQKRTQKPLKNAKLSFQGFKKTSKMEPKVVPGRDFFDFGQSLFLCNTTWFCSIFMVSGCPGAAKKQKKNDSEKVPSKSTAQNRFFPNQTLP